ncbi:NAD-dependent epimerase/dehydratase family protein [Tritonibacter aquimaris]|nr:NAD(P)-dependent oxidoreductase [Tritonibacter aquimaris]
MGRSIDTGSIGAGNIDMGKETVLIMGANGRIGRALRQFAPDPSRFALQARARPAAALPAENWHILSPLAAPEQLCAAAQGCDQILCLAGVVQGQLSDNSALALAAIDAARAAGARRVVLTSSAAVYGAQAGLLREDQMLQPLNDYGRAKAEMEAQARAAACGVELVILRIGNVAGFDAILGGWKPGFCLDQFADGTTPRRSYIGVKTLAQALVDLLDCAQLPEVLNLAQPGPIAMGDLLRAADLSFTTRAAPPTAIAEVAFDLSLLNAHITVAPAEVQALVAQWRHLAL